MITRAEDIDWLRSDATKGIEEGLFFPVFQDEEVRSPALRTYASGDKLQTLTMLYNADAKAIAGSEIEIQSILYKDGKEFMRGEPWPITPDGLSSHDNIPILQEFSISSGMTPGYYVLQLLATDKKNSGKQEGVASQTISFTVAEK